MCLSPQGIPLVMSLRSMREGDGGRGGGGQGGEREGGGRERESEHARVNSSTGLLLRLLFIYSCILGQ